MTKVIEYNRISPQNFILWPWRLPDDPPQEHMESKPSPPTLKRCVWGKARLAKLFALIDFQQIDRFDVVKAIPGTPTNSSESLAQYSQISFACLGVVLFPFVVH